MAKSDLFLAIDLGTSLVKVGAFDSEGRLVASANARYETLCPRPGWVEQVPEAWWAACCQAIKDVASRINPTQLRGASVVGLGPTLVCVDEQGGVVCPASIWSDRRAVAEIAELAERLGHDTSFSLLPRFLWVKRHEPANYHRTRWVFQSFDYISFKLTGQVGCIAPAGQLPPWSTRDIEKSGLDPEKFPCRVCNVGELFGSLASDVAAQVGLPSGLPVVAGTVDTFAAWIGTATTRKGVLCNTVGTSDGIGIVWDQPLSDPKGRVHPIPHLTGRDWILGGAMSSGGIILDWFVRRFYDGIPNPFELITKEVNSVPIGAEGLIALPYLVGEQSPIFDPHARAVFFGITERHTRAHFARAVLESVAFAVRDVCEVVREMGAEIEEVRLAGGAAHNRVWSQIKADMLGRRVLIPEIADSGLLGTAIIAGCGVGCLGNLSEAAEKMVKFQAILEPNPDNHAMYTQLFEFYRSLYVHLKADFVRMVELNKMLQSHYQKTTERIAS